MSQFAHGIRSLDVTASINYTVESKDEKLIAENALNHTNSIPIPIYIEGKVYKDPGAQYEALKSHFESIPWMTYRNNFQAMIPYEYTSDAGWGCMLRSAQMILCRCFLRHKLGKEWRLRMGQKLPPNFVQILRWFVDVPHMDSIFSIHNICRVGLQYEKFPGEWFGPTTACQVIRDLVNLHSKELDGCLSAYLAQGGMIYTDEVEKLCTEVCPVDPSDDECKEKKKLPQHHVDGSLIDPLLNPPPAPVASEWNTGLFILAPMRLGLDRVDPSYIPALSKVFEMPQCVGIIGGKRAHAVFYLGIHGKELLLLDPHTVQPAPELNASFPTAVRDMDVCNTYLRSIHSSEMLVMDLDRIDPSMALGFYCRHRMDYHQLVPTLHSLGLPLSCAPSRPLDYSPEFPDFGLSEAEDGLGIRLEDDEDEFVLV